MKLPRKKSMLLGLAVLGTTAGKTSATLLTFDGLPSGGPLDTFFPPVPNGYGGLDWNGVSTINGKEFSPGPGYYNGVVSPDNVAFNPYGNPASIGISAGTFNLYSAYLTYALNLQTPLDIQVEGFLGSTLLYSNTYVVNSSAPTLVNFNYLGVNSIEFVPPPSQEFVMDNLSETVPDGPSTFILFGFASAGLALMQRKLKRVDL